MMKWKLSFRRARIAALSLTLAAGLTGAAGSATDVAAAEKGTTQPYEALFEGDRIIDVKVTIAEEDWDSILESPLDKDYKSVSVEVDGNKLDNVGFSTKGNLTLKAVASMTDSDRYSFRLKFDKYDKKQTLLGLDKMVLNNNYSDPSYLREYLHYEALRAIGEDAPLTVFVNLYVNGKLYGFYTGVEAVDDSYLARNYGEEYKDGVLYDTDEKSYLQYEESGEYKTITNDMGTDENKTALQHFIRVLNDMPDGEKGSIESVLDVDSALKYIAANAVLGNYDSYNGDKGHNYMLYGDANGKFTVVPWDMNMSFNGYSGGGRNASSGASGTVNTNALTASVDVPVLGIAMESVPMINNLLQVPEYKTRYREYVGQLVDYMEGIGDRIDGLADLIRPYVNADPTKFYTMEQFEANVAYSSSEQANAEGTGGPAGNAGASGGEPPAGMEPPEGTMPPEGARPEGMQPPEGMTRPEGNANAGQDQAPGRGQGMGMGAMAAGSLKTFALNRLANLQAQLGLPVTALPSGSASGNEQPSTGGSASGSSGKGIQVTLDGRTLSFADQQPVSRNGSVFVPASVILEALGAEVSWNKADRSVTATKAGMTVKLTIGSKNATVNGKAVTLSAPVTASGNRTMVPVRFLAESLKLNVEWKPNLSTVTITNP
jgi:spore coat protein CotH